MRNVHETDFPTLAIGTSGNRLRWELPQILQTKNAFSRWRFLSEAAHLRTFHLHSLSTINNDHIITHCNRKSRGNVGRILGGHAKKFTFPFYFYKFITIRLYPLDFALLFVCKTGIVIVCGFFPPCALIGKFYHCQSAEISGFESKENIFQRVLWVFFGFVKK